MIARTDTGPLLLCLDAFQHAGIGVRFHHLLHVRLRVSGWGYAFEFSDSPPTFMPVAPKNLPKAKAVCHVLPQWRIERVEPDIAALLTTGPASKTEIHAMNLHSFQPQSLFLCTVIKLITLMILAVSSQAQVSPSHFTNAAGGGALQVLGPAARTLQVHGGLKARTISKISFRSTLYLAPITLPAQTVFVTLRMSHAATTAATVSSTFAQNHGPDLTTIMSNQPVNLPSYTPGAPLPGSFNHTLTLPTPFVYKGGAPLCWEIQAFGGHPLSAHDGFGRQFSRYQAKIQAQGSGCAPVSSGFPLTHNVVGSSLAGTSLNMQLRLIFGPSLSPGAFVFGFNNINLPFQATAGGVSGLCSLYTTPIASVPTFFDPAGSAMLVLPPMTLNPGLNGVTLVTQGIGLDPAANSLGAVTSNAFETHIVAPFTTVPVQSVIGQSGAITGRVGNGGVVVRFQ